MKIDIGELAKFLHTANQKGYAGRRNNSWVKESDGSTSITIEDGNWRLHDNYFGGQPYGGRMVVFFNNEPVWMMAYYGWTTGTLPAKTIYTALQNALLHMPAEMPLRGPTSYNDGAFAYANTWHGTVERFSGTETINYNGEMVYQGSYLGGLVDQE